MVVQDKIQLFHAGYYCCDCVNVAIEWLIHFHVLNSPNHAINSSHWRKNIILYESTIHVVVFMYAQTSINRFDNAKPAYFLKAF